MRKLIALALVAAAAPMFADDGNSATATATATVTIFAPVALASDQTPFNLGKLVILQTGQTASVQFGGGVIQTKVNCVDFNGASQATATFPTFTLTKDASLGVSFSTTCSNSDLVLVNPSQVTDNSTTSTFQLAGTWTFTSAGDKTADITVTASYI